MSKKSEKVIYIEVSKEFHTALKIFCVKAGISLQSFVVGAIKDKIKKIKNSI